MADTPREIRLPVYMRLGDQGREQLVGYVAWDLDNGEGHSDLARLQAVYPQMMDDSPELQALGIVRADAAP
ncbi:hypothetical protein GPA10_25020 [Streptomyces sp. p1417]|uniref:Uncharacterized protein n=1 Tax=Streptomyces typhae TaxID=2681492 RepID=A0A6L6X2R5_9ACTN|nr:hypothetical protein [Streptomyces typhae]MVO87930.1 hypothetical protein [Streptomyces typhae]